MRSISRNKIGLAGELRVMSELLLRGHNPAKSYLEQGADIVLENGLRIEVKSGHRCHYYYKRWEGNNREERKYYLFTLQGGARQQPQNLIECDFVVLWCIDDDCFFIIPKANIIGRAVGIYDTSDKSRSNRGKHSQYKNRWDLLEVKDG